MGKISEIIESGQPPGYPQGAPSPTSADVKVPRALKEIERGERHAKAPISGGDISKRFGMPIDFIKKTWKMASVAGLLSAFLFSPAQAGDITRGVNFTDGQRVSASDLHSLVDQATINATFITHLTTQTSPLSADYLVLSSAGVLYKATVGSIGINNSAIITGQSSGTPIAADQFLFYSVSGVGLRKVTTPLLEAAIWAITPAYGGGSPTTASIMVYQGGTNATMTVSNLFAAFDYSTLFTNLPVHLAPTNADRFLIFDSRSGSNKQITLNGLITNLPAVTAPNLSAVIPIVNNRTNVNQVTVSNLAGVMIQKFIFPGSFGTGANENTAHGFTTGLHFPQILAVTIQCNTAENGYANGDNVEASAVVWNQGNTNSITAGYNSTNVFYRCPIAQTGFPRILQKTNSTMVAIDTNNWQVTIQAIYFP